MTVDELVEALRNIPRDARVVIGCMPDPKNEYLEKPEISYDAEYDVVRIVGPCDGEDLP